MYGWCIRLNDENKICWMRDYQKWHTIHIQIIMIRYRMRWIVDSLSWWIGVQLIIMHSILHQQSNNHFNLSPCIHILYEWYSHSLPHQSNPHHSLLSTYYRIHYSILFFHYEQGIKWIDMNHPISMIQENDWWMRSDSTSIHQTWVMRS